MQTFRIDKVPQEKRQVLYETPHLPCRLFDWCLRFQGKDDTWFVFCVWIPIVVAGYSFIQLFQAQQFFFKNVVLRKSLTSKGPTPSSTSCIMSTPTFSVKLNYYSKAFKHKSSFIPVMVTSFNTTCCWSLCLSRFSRSSSLNVLCEVVLLTRQIWQNLFAAKLSADPHSAWQARLSAVKRQTVPCTVSVFVLLS